MTYRVDHSRARSRDLAVVLDDRSLPLGLSLLRSAVRASLLQGGSRVVVDIGGLHRLSSPTVAALLWANRQCVQRGGCVVLQSPTDQTLAVLRRTGLGDVMRVEPAGAGAGAGAVPVTTSDVWAAS